MRKIAFIVFCIFCTNLISQTDLGMMYVVPDGGKIANPKGVTHSRIEDISLMPPCTSPANELYANATTLVVNAAPLTSQSAGCSLEASETIDCNTGATQSVWYKFNSGAFTTLYVVIKDNNAFIGCLGSTVWPSGGLPTGTCHPISCNSFAKPTGGGFYETYQLTNLTLATVYYVQVSMSTAGACPSTGNFDINVQSAAPAGLAITNLVPPNANGDCSTAAAGCYLNQYNPSVATVTTTCSQLTSGIASYSVQKICYSFNIGANGSGSVAIQDVTDCGGAVQWANWTLYDPNCTVLSCGTLSNVIVTPVYCAGDYVVCWEYQATSCAHTVDYPFVAWSVASPPACTLPVSLVNFTATKQSNNIELKWKTLSEKNNNYFTIEKSKDATSFEYVTTVNGAGNTNTTLSYSSVDNKPYGGLSYYRLKQTDYDGTSRYSNAISVEYTAKGIGNIQIMYSSPGVITINSECDAEKEITYSVFDVSGKEVTSGKFISVKGNNQLILPVDNYSSGLYFIKMSDKDFERQQKFIKY